MRESAGEKQGCGCKDTGCMCVRRSPAQNSSVALGGVPPIVHETLRSPGQSLDPATAGRMARRIGPHIGDPRREPRPATGELALGDPADAAEHEAESIAARAISSVPAPSSKLDLSGVRIHTDARAAESARAIDAAAYSVGRDIVFASGRYAPGEPRFDHLLAHELVHVLRGGGPTIRRAPPERKLPEHVPRAPTLRPVEPPAPGGVTRAQCVCLPSVRQVLDQMRQPGKQKGPPPELMTEETPPQCKPIFDRAKESKSEMGPMLSLSNVASELGHLCGPQRQPDVPRPAVEHPRIKGNLYQPRGDFVKEVDQSQKDVPEPKGPVPFSEPASNVRMFARLDLSIPFSDPQFLDSTSKDPVTQGAWTAAIAQQTAAMTCRDPKRPTVANFAPAPISWDLGNEKLKLINQRSETMTVAVTIFYSGDLCGPCFAGTLSWDLVITAEQDAGDKTETGKGTLTGSTTAGPCKAQTAAAVIDETVMVDSSMTVEVPLVLPRTHMTFKGSLRVTGGAFLK